MSVDRNSQYEELRRRFVEDAGFRRSIRDDAEATLEAVLGPLTGDERRKLGMINIEMWTDEELIAAVKAPFHVLVW